MDDFKSPAFVVAFEVFDIFEFECCWAVIVENTHNFEKKVSLFFVIKSMEPSETNLLTHASETEWLAGKSTAKNIMSGNFVIGDLADVAMGDFSKIGLIGYP